MDKGNIGVNVDIFSKGNTACRPTGFLEHNGIKNSSQIKKSTKSHQFFT